MDSDPDLSLSSRCAPPISSSFFIVYTCLSLFLCHPLHTDFLPVSWSVLISLYFFFYTFFFSFSQSLFFFFSLSIYLYLYYFFPLSLCNLLLTPGVWNVFLIFSSHCVPLYLSASLSHSPPFNFLTLPLVHYDLLETLEVENSFLSLYPSLSISHIHTLFSRADYLSLSNFTSYRLRSSWYTWILPSLNFYLKSKLSPSLSLSLTHTVPLLTF